MAKGKKKGKNSKDCDRYSSQNREAVNRYKKLVRRLQTHPNDKVAVETLKLLAHVKALALRELKEVGFGGRVDFA
jgi:hypothetical protein